MHAFVSAFDRGTRHDISCCEHPNIKFIITDAPRHSSTTLRFVLGRSGGTVVASEASPREPAPLRQIPRFNPDPDGFAGQEARLAKTPSDPNLAQRTTHVLWCHSCQRMPPFKMNSRHGHTSIPANLVPAEVTPHDTEVVFCGGCPRKLCKECYVNGVGADEDQSTWVSLCGERGIYGDRNLDQRTPRRAAFALL